MRIALTSRHQASGLPSRQANNAEGVQDTAVYTHPTTYAISQKRFASCFSDMMTGVDLQIYLPCACLAFNRFWLTVFAYPSAYTYGVCSRLLRPLFRSFIFSVRMMSRRKNHFTQFIQPRCAPGYYARLHILTYKPCTYRFDCSTTRIAINL